MKYISLIITTLFIFVCLFFALNKKEQILKSPLLNKPIPEINLNSLKNDKLNKSDFNEVFIICYFSDTDQASGLVGLQHQNDKLYRESFLGKISPITGGFLTEKNAFYFYTGVQAEYDLGLITITPSFAPGYYNFGNGKDLGSVLEFKSEVQVSFNLSDSTELGMSYNHISNASFGEKNPGANSYMFNFLKQF